MVEEKRIASIVGIACFMSFIIGFILSRYLAYIGVFPILSTIIGIIVAIILAGVISTFLACRIQGTP